MRSTHWPVQSWGRNEMYWKSGIIKKYLNFFSSGIKYKVLLKTVLSKIYKKGIISIRRIVQISNSCAHEPTPVTCRARGAHDGGAAAHTAIFPLLSSLLIDSDCLFICSSEKVI